MHTEKADQHYSAISTADAEHIIVRGRDLCRDLIGKIDFVEYFFLLVTGREPKPNERFLINALLVSIAEHGLVPSVQAARMTLAAAPEALQGAVAAGLLGCGSVVLGSAEVSGHFLADLVAQVDAGGDGAAVAEAGIRRLLNNKKRVPGFGHPLHSAGDPRADLLLRIAEDGRAAGRHVAMLHAVHDAIPSTVGRSLPINVNGAIPAILLDMDFPLPALKSISLLARTAGLLGHLQEESVRPIGFALSRHAAEAIIYDGPMTPPAA
jgi:citrate synthase